MKKNKKIAVLGGDLRQYRGATELCRRGWDIHLWGIDKSETEKDGISHSSTYKEALCGAAGVLLPLPATVDGISLNCPFSNTDEKPSLEKILAAIPKEAIIVGGRMPQSFVQKAEARGNTVRDYFLSEEFQIENAYITAEAALSIAMNSLDKNIGSARFAIVGYGRIAKHLVRLLKSFGADVTVAARKPSDLAWSRSLGCTSVRIGDSEEGGQNIQGLAHGYDVIYNTVPTWLFDRAFLERVEKNTFIIDLASAPGGVDIGAAKELGSNVLWATSLPGKYAPLSAGDLIAFCAHNAFCEEVSEL